MPSASKHAAQRQRRSARCAPLDAVATCHRPPRPLLAIAACMPARPCARRRIRGSRRGELPICCNFLPDLLSSSNGHQTGAAKPAVARAAGPCSPFTNGGHRLPKPQRLLTTARCIHSSRNCPADAHLRSTANAHRRRKIPPARGPNHTSLPDRKPGDERLPAVGVRGLVRCGCQVRRG